MNGNTKVPPSHWVVAVLIPLIGIVLGIVALARNKVGPGLGLIAASVVSTIVGGTIGVLVGFWIADAEIQRASTEAAATQRRSEEVVQGIEDHIAQLVGESRGWTSSDLAERGGYVECLAADPEQFNCALRGIADPADLIGLASAWAVTVVSDDEDAAKSTIRYEQVANGSFD